MVVTMPKLLRSLPLLLLSLTGTGTSAQTTAMRDQTIWLAGSWACGNPFRTESLSTYTWTPYSIVEESDHNLPEGRKFEETQRFTYDASTDRWTMSSRANGLWPAFTGTARPWMGPQWKFDGAGQRVLYTILDEGSLDIFKIERQRNVRGQWISYSTASCERAFTSSASRNVVYPLDQPCFGKRQHMTWGATENGLRLGAAQVNEPRNGGLVRIQVCLWNLRSSLEIRSDQLREAVVVSGVDSLGNAVQTDIGAVKNDQQLTGPARVLQEQGGHTLTYGIGLTVQPGVSYTLQAKGTVWPIGDPAPVELQSAPLMIFVPPSGWTGMSNQSDSSIYPTIFESDQPWTGLPDTVSVTLRGWSNSEINRLAARWASDLDALGDVARRSATTICNSTAYELRAKSEGDSLSIIFVSNPGYGDFTTVYRRLASVPPDRDAEELLHTCPNKTYWPMEDAGFQPPGGWEQLGSQQILTAWASGPVDRVTGMTGPTARSTKELLENAELRISSEYTIRAAFTILWQRDLSVCGRQASEARILILGLAASDVNEYDVITTQSANTAYTLEYKNAGGRFDPAILDAMRSFCPI